MHLLYGMQTNMRSHNKIRNNGKGEEFSSPFAFPLIAPLRVMLISDKSRDEAELHIILERK